MHNRIINENQLDEWVRGNARDAQGVIIELVWRLVAASSPKPKERRFALGDSINQPGPDGHLDTDLGFDPFVPEGESFWEIGTGTRASDKATSDYKDRTNETPEAVRHDSEFVFVTPLSGRRDWEYTWREDSQLSWLEKRRSRKDWRGVRVHDGTKLIEWLQHFPVVERWLAGVMGLPIDQIQTTEQYWNELSGIGAPPPLTPDVFLANREAARKKLCEIFSGTTLELRLDTRFPGEVPDFVAAHVAALDDDTKVDAIGCCLVISDPDGWNMMTALREPHVLLAAFDLDNDPEATKLLSRARKEKHAVIYAGIPGGIPHPNRVLVPSPRTHQVEEALKKAGYKEQLARTLALKSHGNLTYLLRCLQNLSLMPEWAQGTQAAELAVAQLLGSWNEESDADKAISELLSKKAYGEWIGTMRDVLVRPGTPLICRNGVWKFAARYEGWHALGPWLFDEHVDRLREAAVEVLRERDPKFELPPEDRFAANIRGKILKYSTSLRSGLSETLALLGSHPKALTYCSFDKAETTAVLAVREILTNSDWVIWASLNDLLPLLAEAAPAEFLNAVETSLKSAPCPFDTIFAQERNAMMGGTYIAGLLWGLEALAWDAEHLARVVAILGELAARDPGGSWTNRPANSLSTILLPWFPQTCASLAKRQAAVAILLGEHPDVAWKLLLDLLPSSLGASSGSYKPKWRETIPDDWSGGVTNREYWEQIKAYAELAIRAATGDCSRLADLVERLDDLPSPGREQLLSHLRSDAVVSMSEPDRLPLWTKLNDLVAKHRRFADANCAITPEEVKQIATVADCLTPKAPVYRYQRLFSDRDYELYEEIDDYHERSRRIDGQRQRVLNDIFVRGGTTAVLEFAQAVESPWRVGYAFATIAENDAEKEILPILLESEDKSLAQFTGGFVLGRSSKREWQWVDEIDMSQWSPSQKGQFLAYLPFTADAWERSAQLLGEDESPYWSKANANPYAAKKDVEIAVEHLLQYGRPHDAIRCLDWLRHNERPLDAQQAIRALLATVQDSPDNARKMDTNATVKIIKTLQDAPTANPDDVMRIEWAFLPLLNKHDYASPRLLEQRLAESPESFCEVIHTIFRSKNKDKLAVEYTEEQKNIATHAYRLLDGWSIPPGSRRDGTFDGDAFTAWLEAVKAACEESGHLDIATSRIGHVLTHSPSDPDGLWIHRSVATALNAPDANHMRDGFRIELYNSRGFHCVDPTGEEERKLAQKYRTQADEVETSGYHRLAGSLRELAASYDREAEQRASEDLFDD